MSELGVVTDAGGGHVDITVDRDLCDYPAAGERVYVLAPDDFDRLIEMLTEPPKVIPELRKLFTEIRGFHGDYASDLLQHVEDFRHASDASDWAQADECIQAILGWLHDKRENWLGMAVLLNQVREAQS